ncbi:hypothetical protein Fmac_001755 [Flemingia macrophylla]|uniref:Uncharacterized protein n=1 Tax=Flemingia macrophylla TaxID=520843 RepID=A0ABD1NI11_9FABA
MKLWLSKGDFGRLGHSDHSDMLIPRPIKALQGLMLQQVACGDSHCPAITMDSHVLERTSVPFHFFLMSYISQTISTSPWALFRTGPSTSQPPVLQSKLTYKYALNSYIHF